MSHCYHKRFGKPLHRFTWHCEWYEAKGEFREAVIKFGNRIKAIIIDVWKSWLRL